MQVAQVFVALNAAPHDIPNNLMLTLTADQRTVLDRMYAYVVNTGRWPKARALRHELYRDLKIRLEDVAQELGHSIMVCNDITADTTDCLFHLPALQYIDAAADERRLIGQLVAWLVEQYLKDPSQILPRGEVASALSVDQQTADRVVGFLYYTSGLIQCKTNIGDGMLGCATFGIDDRILDFDGVQTYEGLLEAIEGRGKRQAAEAAVRKAHWESLTQESEQGLFAKSTTGADNLQHLHSSVLDASSRLFSDAHYNDAVRRAFERFETEVQMLSDVKNKSGQDLMAHVFAYRKSTLPVLPLSRCQTQTQISEQNGLQFMAMGAMTLIRNPLSHGSAPEIESDVAEELLAVASVLFRQLDRVQTFMTDPTKD